MRLGSDGIAGRLRAPRSTQGGANVVTIRGVEIPPRTLVYQLARQGTDMRREDVPINRDIGHPVRRWHATGPELPFNELQHRHAVAAGQADLKRTIKEYR